MASQKKSTDLRELYKVEADGAPLTLRLTAKDAQKYGDRAKKVTSAEKVGTKPSNKAGNAPANKSS